MSTKMMLKITKAKGIFKKTQGLIGKEKIGPLLLETRFGIHTFFLQSPIDIIILDEKNRVVKLKEKLNPNKIFFWNPKYYLVLELPGGTIEKQKIKLFDSIIVLE